MAAVIGIGIGLIGSGVSAQGSKKAGKQARRGARSWAGPRSRDFFLSSFFGGDSNGI